jgi:hypothetical protein
MGPSKGAGRPSLLVLNPRNPEASAERRALLLAAFDSLDEDARADLLEAVETMVSRASSGVDQYRDEARDVIRRVYDAAGWGDDVPE